jgi:3-deoxy-D-manno-octulosonic-acid transferase
VLLAYRLLSPLVFAAMLPGFLSRLLRRGNFGEKFGQRFASYSARDLERFRERHWIWMRSISVGETFIALKLAHEMHRRDPAAGVLLSTTTTTGFAEARRAACDWLEPIYNPVDFRPVVRRALDALRPGRIILIEGELWPNLLAEGWARRIPISLANARLSPRSEARFRKARAWCGPLLRLLDRVCVAEREDCERWASLGIDPARITCTGSIKFDNPAATASRAGEFRAALAPWGIAGSTPILIAGSTWAPEERLLAAMLPALRKVAPDLFLILVPRHVERSAAIIEELRKSGLVVVRRSELRTAAVPAARPDLLLVDATGELRDWYGTATIAFVGKSMPGIEQAGGQNLAEPAQLGLPVVVGPHMENFRAITAAMLARDALVQVPDAAALEQALARLLADPDARARIGREAQAVFAAHAGATARTAALLLDGKIA